MIAYFMLMFLLLPIDRFLSLLTLATHNILYLLALHTPPDIEIHNQQGGRGDSETSEARGVEAHVSALQSNLPPPQLKETTNFYTIPPISVTIRYTSPLQASITQQVNPRNSRAHPNQSAAAPLIVSSLLPSNTTLPSYFSSF